MSIRPLVAWLLLGVLVAPASADFITGHVVDATGAPVPGVDIDVKSLLGGGNPLIFNDGTDINGFFFTTVPPGLYRVIFKPPPPPMSTHLVLRVEDIAIVGTTDMGVLTLSPGVALSGRTLSSTGLPVAGVNLDIIDTTGNNIDLPNDMTDAFGQFLVAAPVGPSELRLNTLGVVGATLASQSLDLSLAGDTSVGDLTLPDGWRIMAVVTGPGGLPLEGVDTDTIESLSQEKLYTPGDTTDALGMVSVVVPAGSFDFKVCPDVADLLVAAEVPNLPVTSDVNLGMLGLPAGVSLSGTVTSGGLPVGGVDVDVRDSTTGIQVALCSDNTNGSGGYAIVVPPGTYDVDFEPPFALPYGAVATMGVTVAGSSVLHADLPACAFSTQYGAGLGGTGGAIPTLSSSGGAPRLGNPGWTLELSNGLGGEMGLLIIGLAPAAFPFRKGTLLVSPAPPIVFLSLPLSGPAGTVGQGTFSLPLAVPDAPILVGFTWYGQFAVADPGAPAAMALSNGLSVTYCP